MDINDRATTASYRAPLDEIVAFDVRRVPGGALVDDVAKKLGCPGDLVGETAVAGVTDTGRVVGATVASSTTVLPIEWPGIGDERGLFLKKNKKNLRVDTVLL